MSVITRQPTAARSTAGRSRIGMGLWRGRFEITQYVRSGDTVMFTFLFPVIMLGLFSVAFGADGDIQPAPGLPPVSVAQMYLPAMLAAGLLASGLQNLAIDIAVDRSEGVLKRLGATPLSPVSYFLGKILQVGATGIAQAALLLGFAAVVLQVPLPIDPEKWVTFAWVFILGITGSALLGVALSAVPRSSRGAVAVVIPIVLVVQFISGVYFQFYMLPEWLQTAASALPVKWMAQGMRYVFLPEDYSALEQNGVWDIAGVAIALTVWLVVGLVLARVTFRWNKRDA
ncbi:ABC-2 type transport system permease protein [Microbacterium sp. cf046]|uniref:ABC transporter permease n=1 Tax=Microbacterium sp. cf046 TaxID=1761803 RepID=UPI0008E0BAA5|nr:ABC transporter permease [Microbacterium sp. cf046]SFR92087.1 ABC-2 type transport system permease protein [Microbacterium sp. cf046]